ncbi:MAG: prolyl oligopeptidase family serine peptidase [Patescibacteria group bacterium]
MVKKVSIPFQSNLKIDGNLHINKKSTTLIIICHGYQDSKDEPVIKRIANLLDNNFNVFRFTFTDRLKPFLPEEKQNISVIVNYFSTSYKEIVLLGASLGGLSVLLSINNNLQINKLILINPFVYFFKKVAWRFRKMLITMLFLYPFAKNVRDNINFYFNNIDPKLIVVPTLLIVAEKDEKVSSIHGETLYKQLGSKQKKMILDENIDHGLNKEIYIKQVVNYIIDWLK